MNDKKITLTYIAKKANVSVATVSRVLNGNSSVDEKIQNKIKKIINSDGYNLKKNIKNKQIISVIIPDITNPFFANIIEGIENTANLYGYHIILSQFKENRDISNFKDITNIGVSGYIIIPSVGSTEYFNDIINNSNLPIVFLDRKVEFNNINYVGSDNKIGAYIRNTQ